MTHFLLLKIYVEFVLFCLIGFILDVDTQSAFAVF